MAIRTKAEGGKRSSTRGDSLLCPRHPDSKAIGATRRASSFPIPSPQSLIPFCRRGVTIVELLVVVAVISILAAAMMGGLTSVNQLAREARTKATIAKIDHFIEVKMESYKTRRVPIDTSTMTPRNAAHDSACKPSAT